MKFVCILLLLVAVVAIEASAQGDDSSPVTERQYKCNATNECPTGYGCRCDEFTKVCVHCRECTNDESCRDKYNNDSTDCKCKRRLCVGCIEN